MGIHKLLPNLPGGNIVTDAKHGLQIAWSAVRQSVPPTLLPAAFLVSKCHGISWEVIPKNADTTEPHRRLCPEQQKREGLKRLALLSSIKVDNSRLDLAS
jgi:hypothetical protein